MTRASRTSFAPLTFALTLTEALRRHAIERGLLLDGDGGPVGVNLSDALGLRWIVPMVGFPFAVIGAELRSGRRRPAVQAQPYSATSNR